MNLDWQTSLLVEYEDLLDDYTLIARESKDGTTTYIVGQHNGDPTQSPLYGMYSIDMYTGDEECFDRTACRRKWLFGLSWAVD